MQHRWLLAIIATGILTAPTVLASPPEALPLDPIPEVEEPATDTAPGPRGTFTFNADFDQGSYFNVGHPVPHQLELSPTYPFKFIWIAVSGKGTAVRIDTRTGQVMGEYYTSPSGMAKDPSRTTVDKNGNVWVTNRAEGSLLGGVPRGSILHIGLVENGQCVDRNNNGVIDTSSGLNDIRTWTNAGGVDTDGGVDTAADECILHFVRVHSTYSRHVAVTPSNDVWVSGIGNRDFDLVSGTTGAILRWEVNTKGCGGYGGLIDAAGVIWSSTAGSILRWPTGSSLAAGGTCLPAGDAYGMCRDSLGNVWTSTTTATLKKYSPAGVLLATYANPAGAGLTQGCAIDKNNHVWVSNGFDTGSVSHFLPTGVFVGAVPVTCPTTGVAVDGDGYVWATGWGCQKGIRIDPALGLIGGGGVRIGAVDMTSPALGGVLYNYSDMTGALLLGPPNYGTWIAVQDSGIPAARWGKISWNGFNPAGGQLYVRVSSSDNGVSYTSPTLVSNGACFSVPDGRFLKVYVHFVRAPSGQSPILYDLSAQVKPFALSEARALFVGTAVPENPSYRTVGLSAADAGSASSYVVNADVASGRAHLDVLQERVAGSLGCDSASATGYTRVAYLSLANGAVEVEGLLHHATVNYDVNTGAGTLTRTWHIAQLRVMGTTYASLDQSNAPPSISVPGVGTLTLFQGSTTNNGYAIEYRGELLRLDLAPSSPLAYSDTDLVIGALHLHAGVTRATNLAPTQNDAASRRDAGPLPATAVPIGPGPADGEMPAGDAVDVFAYTATMANLKVVLAPAHKVAAVGGQVTVTIPGSEAHTLPTIAESVTGASDTYRVRVINAAGTQLIAPATATPSSPAVLQGTVPLGTAYIEVTRISGASNPWYSLAVAGTP